MIGQVVVRGIAMSAEEGGDVWGIALKFREEDDIVGLAGGREFSLGEGRGFGNIGHAGNCVCASGDRTSL